MKTSKGRNAAREAVATDLSKAVQQALIARSFAELTKGRLPLPYDEKAEWLVLSMLSETENRDVRSAAQPDWFFLDLHKAILQVILEAPARDERAIALGLARRLRNVGEDAAELAAVLCSRPVYTSAELYRAIDRLQALRDLRELTVELERLALGLRGETMTPDEVRKRLRDIVSEDDR